MKKRIVMALIALILIMTCCGTAMAAQSVSTPKYSIFVRVFNLGGSLCDTCNNSAGYIVMPTRRQDGSAGTTWWARVEAGDWDDWFPHCYAMQTGDQGEYMIGYPTRIDGFPTEIRLVKDNSATSTNYMTNDNKTYKAHYGFEVCLKTGTSGDYVVVARFEETTNIYGKWSDEKKLGTNVYPCAANVKSGTTTGPSTADIPMNGTGTNIYQFNTVVMDQYGAEWYQDNVNMLYTLGSNLPSSGLSIDSNGVLTVDSSAANSATSGPVFETTVRAESSVSSDNHVVNTLPLTIYYPKLTVRYYNESANHIISEQYPYLWTQWVHNVEAPAKESNSNYHYSFRGWEVNDNTHSVVSASQPYLLTKDTTFTARYNTESHSMVYNETCTARICSVCSYTESVTLPDIFSGSGTQSNPYRITGTDDWNHLAAFLGGGGDVSGKYFRLENDISVTISLGTADHPFTANLDGDGHTLTFTDGSSDSNTRTAPFGFTNGVTIRNLRTVGSVTKGNYDRASGLIGENSGNTTIENCRVSMSLSGRDYVGGFCIGNGGALTFTGCVFDGSISARNRSGGFVSWEEGNLTLNRCLFIPASVSGSSSIGTFYFNNSGTHPATMTSSYYQTAFGIAQGKQAFSVGADSSVNIVFGTPVAAYSVGGHSIYPMGFMHGGVFYAGEGESVNLALSADAPDGLKVNGFITGAGTLTGGGSAWTLTMPGENVVISAGGFVPLLGQGMQADPWRIDGSYSYPRLVTGWYEVIGDVAISERLVVTGDVHLILGAGTTLTAARGISVYSNQSLTIDGGGALIADASGLAQAAGIGGSYADDGQRSSGYITINGGTVTATGGQYGAGIGGGMYGFCGPVTINGGTVTANAGTRGAGIGGGGNNNWAGNYGNTATITVNGGTVTATGNSTGSGIGGGGGSASTSGTVKGGNVEAVVINGGRVTAISPNGAGIGPARYSASGSVLLGWNDESDFIEASSFSGTVAFKEGKFFVLAGTHTLAVPDHIGGSRLVPLDGTPEFTLTLIAPVFDTEEEGYARPEAQPITVVSTGNCDATIVSAALGGANMDSFALNKTDGATIPAGSTDSATYTVQPNANLPVGTYTATVTVIYNDGAAATADLSFTVNIKPTYTLTVTAPEFDAVEKGYARPEEKPLTIISTGNSDATITSVTLSGDGADGFTLNRTDGATIPAGSTDSATYTVRPKAGLKPGVYTAVVAVWYDNDTPASGVLRFTVNEKWYPITFAMDEYIEVMMVQTDSHSYSPDNAVALEGETVQFEPLCCDDRFEIGSVTVTAEDGTPVACERYSEYYEEYDFTDTGWRFIMPGTPVTVRVTPAFGEVDFTLPAFLTTVEAEAFEGIAAGIIDVPANCTSIGDRAFRNCPNLTQIRIPDGCTLGTDVFDSCEMVYVYGTAGSSAEAYCSTHANCEFVALE